MKKTTVRKKKSLLARCRPLLRWLALVLAAGTMIWLAIWLTERSLKSAAKRRHFQAWLEDSLNADVDFSGSAVVRLNLVRSSRLGLNRLEIDHPNVIFAGKMLTADHLTAYMSPWSVFKVWPGSLEIVAEGLNLLVEENENGEWSTTGLMNPLASPETEFPYFIPRISDIETFIEDGSLTLRRRGLEMRVGLRGRVASKVGSDRFTVRLRQAPLSFGAIETEDKSSGILRQFALSGRFVKPPGKSPTLIPEHGSVQVDNLPVAILPFLFPGIPTAATQGNYQGRVGLREIAPGSYLAELDGHLHDANLSVFGLPNNAPLRARWPLGGVAADSEATLHLGPSGFGAFQISIPFDLVGNPKQLNLRGDVAALDDLPSLLTRHSQWLDWLTRRFPSIEWQSGQWLAFGWTGENMALRLTRTAAGLHLFGESQLHNGRARVALSPTDRAGGITVAAERIDIPQTAAKLASMLPEPFRASVTGQYANLTWNGAFPEREGELSRSWASALVFSRPEFELTSGGAWWRELARLPARLADQLPEWGGGNDAELLLLADKAGLALDQLSIVADKKESGDLRVEFVGFGDAFGQIGGWLEYSAAENSIRGEFYLTGESRMVLSARRANQLLGQALDLLANNALGLRVTFTWDQEAGVTFSPQFIDDALKLRDELRAADTAETGEFR